MSGAQPPTTASEPVGADGDERGDILTASASQRPERSIVRGISTFSTLAASAPGRTRTGNLRIRRPMLYPLSYGGVRKRLTSLRHQHDAPYPDGRTALTPSSASEDDREEITPP